jgi:phosphoribosylaminoimidazolecarboxamide formyltransferase/IMP cyclohydrolase
VGVETQGGRRPERALLSVDDKTGLEPFARGLSSLGIELWATSGTRGALSVASVEARPLEELTGVGSWFHGRVKTLHPAVFGGILAPRTAEGLEELRQHGLVPFDLVAVNFYPFERRLTEVDEREELVDIGGVTLARAAAKNHRWVTVLTDPAQYEPLLKEMRENGGTVSARTRLALALRAFERCARYDTAIASGLEPGEPRSRFPRLAVWSREPFSLRYGENPDQRAASYAPAGPAPFAGATGAFDVLQGDSPSFTNLLDLDAAARIVAGFDAPAAAVVKHATPCGAAFAPTVRAALEAAIETDPVARYGCAIATNRPIAESDLAPLHGVFVDVLAAPEFDAGARTRLASRKKAKVLRLDPVQATSSSWEAKNALGRLLVQEAGRRPFLAAELKHVTGPAASAETLASLEFAWQVVRHAKSNAIVLAQGSRTVGIGSGQPTRVKAVELACEVAGPRARGAVLASDAFFPFPDGIEAAGKAGVAAVVQPGGSVRDPDVIAAAARYGMTMYFTGWRVFRH